MCGVTQMTGVQVLVLFIGCLVAAWLVVLSVPLLLSFLAMPGLCCSLRATHNHVREGDEREKFRYRFPRSVALTCKSASACPAADHIDDEDVEAHDDVNVPLPVALEECFGPRGSR